MASMWDHYLIIELRHNFSLSDHNKIQYILILRYSKYVLLQPKAWIGAEHCACHTGA